MSKPKKKLTAAQKAARKRRRKNTMIIFINGKMKRIPREPKINDEFLRANADPIWLHQNELWHLMDENSF